MAHCESEIPSKEMKTIPWTKVFIGCDLLVKFRKTDSTYEILIGNAASGDIWHEFLRKEDILKRNMEFNPSLEMSIEKLLSHLSDCLLTGDNPCCELRVGEKSPSTTKSSQFCIEARMTLSGLPFIWKFFLQRLDSTVMCQQLLLPLIHMSSELLEQRKLLFSLLATKDCELEKLKAECGSLHTRRGGESRVFNSQDFINSRQQAKVLACDRNSLIFGLDGQLLYKSVTDGEKNIADNIPALSNTSNSPPKLHSSNESSSLPSTNDRRPDVNAAASRKAETKDMELLRRQQLEKRLADKEEKEIKKKKKKLQL